MKRASKALVVATLGISMLVPIATQAQAAAPAPVVAAVQSAAVAQAAYPPDNPTLVARAKAQYAAILKRYGMDRPGHLRTPSPAATVQGGATPQVGYRETRRCNTGYFAAAWNSSKSYRYGRGDYCIMGSGYDLMWQPDGNLVIYRWSDGDAIWATGSNRASAYAGAGYTLNFLNTAPVAVFALNGSTRWSNKIYLAGHHASYYLMFLPAIPGQAYGQLAEMVVDYTVGRCYWEWYVHIPWIAGQGHN